MNQKTIILTVVVLSILILAYFSNMREGFQAEAEAEPSTTVPPVTSNEPRTATPEACILLLSMYENMKENYTKAEASGNPYILNSLSSSIKHVQESLTEVGCLFEA